MPKICYCREVENEPSPTEDESPRESTSPSSYGFTDGVIDFFTCGAYSGVKTLAADAAGEKE